MLHHTSQGRTCLRTLHILFHTETALVTLENSVRQPNKFWLRNKHLQLLCPLLVHVSAFDPLQLLFILLFLELVLLLQLILIFVKLLIFNHLPVLLLM